MADARVPPSGPPARDPTAPARLLDAAAEVGLRVERAQRDVDRLEAAVDRLALASGVSSGRAPQAVSHAAGAPRRAAGASPAKLTDARSLAIDLAVGGGSRSAIREQLSASFGLADPDVVLGDVAATSGREPYAGPQPHGGSSPSPLRARVHGESRRTDVPPPAAPAGEGPATEAPGADDDDGEAAGDDAEGG